MRKLLAALLILALVIPLSFSALTLFSVSGWALKRSFYQEHLGQEKLYTALLAEARARKDRPWDVGDWTPLPGLEGLPAEALAKALAQTVSAGYLRGQSLQAVDSFFDAVEDRAARAELAVDLRPLKRDLGGPSRQAFADALAEALPDCRTGQDPLAASSRLLACRPSGMQVKRASQLIHAALPAALARVPDRHPLSGVVHLPAWLGPVGTASLVWAAVVLALIAAAFWVGTAFVGGRNRGEVKTILGWSLLPSALLTLAVGLTVRFAFLGRWLLSAALADALRPALHAASRGFLIAGAVALGLSLSLIAWPVRPEG
jgi:hypothetical protein